MEAGAVAADAAATDEEGRNDKNNGNLNGEGGGLNAGKSVVVVDWKLLGIEEDDESGVKEKAEKGIEEGPVVELGAATVEKKNTAEEVEAKDADAAADQAEAKNAAADQAEAKNAAADQAEAKNAAAGQVGSLKRKSIGGDDDENLGAGDSNPNEDAKRVKAAADDDSDKVEVVEKMEEEKSAVAVEVDTATADSSENITQEDSKAAIVDEDKKLQQKIAAFDKDDIVVIDVDDESSDEVDGIMEVTQPLSQTSDGNNSNKVDSSNVQETEKTQEVEVERKQSNDDKKKEEMQKVDLEGRKPDEEAEVGAAAQTKSTKVIEEVIMIEDSSNASSAQQHNEGPPPESQNGPVVGSAGGWDHEKVLLISEIESLREKVNRLTERQMLIEDFALVEYSARFRTFFHARDLLLDMGRKRKLTDPACALAPGSSYLIEILRIVNEKAEGEIEELHVTEKDIVAIEKQLKNLKDRLSDSSFAGQSPTKSVQLVSLNASVSSDTSFPPTLPHKFTSDNQPVYDSGVPAGVLPNPLYNSVQQQNGGGRKRVRQRIRPKINCEVCQLSMNVPLYRNKHIYEHVGIIYACPVCKEKKGKSTRGVNKCLREKHGVIPQEGPSSQALRYIQDEDGSYRLITSKEELEAEQKSYLTKFNALSPEEKEQVKVKYLADQERSKAEDDKKTECQNDRNDSSLNWDVPFAADESMISTQSPRPKGDSEDIEIVEVVPGTPATSTSAEKRKTETEPTAAESRKQEIFNETKEKLLQQGIALKGFFSSSSPSPSTAKGGPKLGKPFPVPTLAVSSSSTTSNSADGDDGRNPPVTSALKPFFSTSPPQKKKNRGRKRAGLLPLANESDSSKLFMQKQQQQSGGAGRYFQSNTAARSNNKSGSGLSMVSRSILGRGLPQQQKHPPRNNLNPSFINATEAFDDYESSSFGPTRSAFSSFGERVSPYPNTSGNSGIGRGRGVGGGISSYVGTGRGLNNPSSSAADPSSTRRLIPMPSSSSMMDSSSYETRYSASAGGGEGRLGASRNIPPSEERFKVNASCLGDNVRSKSGSGGLKRFDYSSGLGGGIERSHDSSLTDDCPSPSLLSGRPSFYEIDLGFAGAEYRRNNSDLRNNASSRNMGRDRSDGNNGYFGLPSASPEKPMFGVNFSGPSNTNSPNNNINNSRVFGERYFRSEEAIDRDPILRNPRYSGSGSSNYTMSSRPAQYGYFTTPGSGSAGGGGGGGVGNAPGSNLNYSQGQFSSYSEYAKSVLSQNRLF